MSRSKILAEINTQFNIRSTHFKLALKEIILSGYFAPFNEDIEYENALAIRENIDAEDDLIAHFAN